MKVCGSCKVEKQFSEFYKDTHQPDGFYRRCKHCHAKSTSKWRKTNRATEAAAARRRRALDPDRFREIQRRSAKKTYPRHAAKIRLATQRWYSENTDRAAEYHRTYRVTYADEKRAYHAAYYIENAERIKGRIKITGPAWAAKNPDKRRAIQKRHQTAKLRATPPWADHDAIKAVYAKCVEVERATGIPHHVDHIVPLQGKTVRGLHVHFNLQIIPGRENQSKGARFWPDMPSPVAPEAQCRGSLLARRARSDPRATAGPLARGARFAVC